MRCGLPAPTIRLRKNQHDIFLKLHLLWQTSALLCFCWSFDLKIACCAWQSIFTFQQNLTCRNFGNSSWGFVCGVSQRAAIRWMALTAESRNVKQINSICRIQYSLVGGSTCLKHILYFFQIGSFDQVGINILKTLWPPPSDKSNDKSNETSINYIKISGISMSP